MNEFEIRTSDKLDKLLAQICEIDWDYVENGDKLFYSLQDKADYFINCNDDIGGFQEFEAGLKLGMRVAKLKKPIYLVSDDFSDCQYYFIDEEKNIEKFMKSVLDPALKEEAANMLNEKEKELEQQIRKATTKLQEIKSKKIIK